MEPLTRPAAVDRRSLLRAAAALGVSFLVPGLSARAAAKRGPERPKSLITLWMQGGPSQLETWDPHPGTTIGGPTKAIRTTLRDVEIADGFPAVAEQLHHLSVIRSLVSKEGDHERGTYHLLTGYRPDPTVVHPSLGAILAHALPDAGVEIPMHVSLAGGAGFALPRGGYLGDDFDAFRIADPGQNLRNLRARVGEPRQARRQAALEAVSREFRTGREARAAATLHEATLDKALAMMSSEQLRAFDLDGEPADLRERYGASRFGRGCLMARRLVEQGVRAVQVVLDGFDTHAENFTGHRTQAAILDPALAALVRDLVEHELLDSTVLLCIGEFGRTPRINPLDGRDHWPSGFSCLLGGGGLASGLLIGATDPTGASKDPSDPVSVADLYATILSALQVDYQQEIITPIGRPIALCEGRPIERLLAAP
ncbi:MAG: DUF1501 domain-containing protein [Planctomyces sp.]|nr:DUF1501 domain-containing protein [Planctomyces sp.]